MAAVNGVGLSWPSKLTKNQTPKWGFSPSHRRCNPSSSSSATIRMTASVDEKKKTFTLEKSEEAFSKAKVIKNSVFFFFFLALCSYNSIW